MSYDIKLANEFGRLVKLQREKQGLNQAELADKAGLDRTYIGGIERGERNPSLNSIYKIANALKIEPEKLLPKSE